MAWYDDPEEVRRATAEALGVFIGVEEPKEAEEPELGPRLSLDTVVSDESRALEVKPKEWWEDPDAVEAAMKEAGVAYATPMRSERSLGEEFSTGLARGTDQTQGLLYGFSGLVGQALGIEEMEQFGLENYARKMEDAAKNQASIQDPAEEIDGLGDFGLYAAGIISEQIPQLLISLGGAGLGGAAAKTAAKRIIANEVAKRTAAGMAKDEAAKEVAQLVAQNALTAAGTAANRGAIGGAYLANFGQIAGGSFGQMAQELGQGDAAQAAAFAAPGAALDTLGEVFVAGKFLKPFTRTGAAQVVGDIEKPWIRVGRGIAGGVAGGSAVEGTTEYVQTGLEQAALGSADPNRTVEDVVMTPEAERERQIAAAAGATVGGLLGGAGSGFEVAFSPRTTEALRQKRQQQTGTTSPVGPEEIPQQGPADEEWSEPVTIQSRNEDYNGLEYRQNKAGQVWAFNVPEVSRFGAFAIPTKYGQGVLLNPAFEGASEIRSEVKARLAEMADPEAFKAPLVTPPKKVEENLEDADLVEGEEVAANAEAIAAAAERRRQRDQEILTRDLESAAATLARPQEDAKGFVDSLKEGDQVSVLTEDGEGNAYSIPMTFVRLNQNGQAQLRSEPDEDNNVVTRLYDQDEFNRITTRPAEQVAPAATTTGTGIKVSPLTAPIRPAAEGEQLSEAERAQNLLYFKDVEGRKIDDNLWINSARELGVEITPETTGAVAEQEIRNRFGVERKTTKQDDPASQVLMDALGPNPTKQKLESMTGTRWTGKGSKFTWMLPDKLGGEGIPITTRFFNRKTPAEALPIPERPANRGFKPEEQGTTPAAPDIQSVGPDLIAKSSAEFVGVKNKTSNELINDRPGAETRGQLDFEGKQNPTESKRYVNYLAQIDSAADTTIRQMNYLGQPVLVTPETAQSLAEANQFWIEHEQRQKAGTARKDRQPVRFYTQERSDKDGNRNTFITGVTYEGRTYRVGKTPQEFSVDRPLTSRGAKSRRRGLGIYDPIRIASAARRERSEAGMAGRQTEAGPLAEALKGVQGRANLVELNEAENAVYGFFDAKITNPILNIEDPAVTTEVRDTALETARGKVAEAFLKAKKGIMFQMPPPSSTPTSYVLPARQRIIGEKVADRLTAFQEAKRAQAIQALRDKFQGLRDKEAKAKAGARGTGTAKALKMSPQGAMNLITRAKRGQKTGIAESKRLTRDEAMTALQELVDFGALDQKKKDEQIKRILDKAEKFTEIERDEMQQSIISELAKEDKAAAAKQGRKYSRSEAQVAQERRLVISTINLLDDPNIRALSPYRIGNSALSAAKRTATRKGMTRDEVSFDDETQGAEREAAGKTLRNQPDDKGQITQGKLAERGRPIGVENKLGGVALFSNDYEESLDRYDSLTDSDRDILNRLSDTEIERGNLRGRQIRGITENERLRAARVVAFLQDKISYEQLYPNRVRKSGEQEYIRRAAQRRANARRSGQPDAGAQGVPDSGQSAANLAGVAESRAARTADPAPAGRPERVVGASADPAGTVQGQSAGPTGGRSVQPTPRRTRAVAAAAQRDFAGALLGLNEAETAALPQGTVDRVYQSYLSTFDGVLAERGNNPLTASAAPAADTVTADGKKMFERFADARLSPDQQRAAIIRSNMAQAYRAGLFDEDPVMSAINKIAADKTQPMNLRLMAKEFAKNAKRGVRFDRVVLDIGRFTKPGNRQTTWAGLFSVTPEGGSVVSVNLDNLHDKNSVPLTFLHELQHVVIRDKVRRNIPLTRTEEQALARLEDLRGQAVIAAARQQGLEVGATPDVNALAEQLYALTDPNRSESGVAVDNRRLAGLVNLEEFVIEMIGNPDMVQLLSELGFGEARTDGKRFSLTGALKNAWNAVVELLTGTKIDPTSPLAMAFKDSWTVNFGTARNPNITEIKASKRLADRQQAQTRQQYVEGEIETRDLAGTSRERNRIMQEITGPADRSAVASEARVREAAQNLTEDEFVEWAQDNGFNFVEPRTIYSNLRVESGLAPQKPGITNSIAWLADQAAPEQGSRNTVQVAESRAVDPNDLIQIGMRVRVTARDADGTRFRFFARPGTDSTMMGTPVRVFQEVDKDGATVNRTRVVQADLIEREQPLAMSKTYGEWVPAPVQSAESRAVGSQVAVVPDGGVEKEFHILNTVEDTNGDVGLDLSKLIESLRDKASQVSGEVSGKKFLVIIDDERREFTTLPALQRFLANAGIPRGTIARVFRNANNQIAVNFDENINQTTERAIREQNRNAPVQVAESRARRSVNPPVPSKAEWEEEIGEELVQANIILKGKAPLKLIKVRDDLDYDTSYISGTHIFKTPEGDIITASKEDGQWDMQSIFNGEISTFEEDSITNALERLSEELAEKRMMLAGEIYDEFIDMPKDHPFWNSDLAKMDLNDAPKLYRMIDYYRSLPKQPTNQDIRESRAVGRPVDTTSEKFKRWFKQSAVTNGLVGGKDNQPLRMYHGSPYDLQAVFRSEADLQREMGVSRWGDVRFDQEDFGNEGIYFTTDPNYSSVYSRQNSGANTTPVYLSIQNPYFVNERDTWWESVSRFFKALRAVAGGEESWNKFEAEDENRFFTRRIENIANPLSSVRSSGYVGPRDLKRLRDQGYDGIINLAPNGNRNAPEIIVFSPTQIKSAITNSGEFSFTNPDIRESRAVGRRPYEITTTTYNGKTYTRPGLFGGENADLDPKAQDLVGRLKRFKNAAEKFADMKGNELTRLIKKHFRDGNVPTNLINDALGNLDNPLTEQQFSEIKQLEATDPEAAAAKQIAYLGENRAKFRTERQAPALLQLPEELAEYLREIGNDLESLQRQALELGIPKGDMAAAFKENLGIYLTRSYNAFIDQAGWEKTLRAEDAALGEQSRMGQFRNTVRSTLIGQRADDLMADAMSQGRTLSRAEAERQAKEGTTMEEVDQIVENYIAYTKQEPSSESFSGMRLPGRQNIKSLTQRKMLSDALRDFYGQVENPAINFVTSYAKLSSLLANHKFQSDLKNLGLKEGWFWNPDSLANRGQRPPAGYERIAADNDKSLSVLAGLYANSDLVRGLRETFPPSSLESAQWWLHPFMKATGLSMGMKTVGSIASQIRNYWSSYAPLIAGGNFTVADLFNKDWRKNWKEAHQTALTSVFRNYGDNRQKMMDDIKFLYEEGVMGESLTVGLLNDLTRLGKDAAVSDDKFIKGFEKYLTRPGKRVWDAGKGVWKKAEQVYGMTDDIFKIFTYLSELDKYRKVYPEKSELELKQKAAGIARDIHWTYSKAPAIVNELKKFPFIAPFITFTTETIRITANLGKLAMSERKLGGELRGRGLAEGNAELVRQGDELLKISNKRLRGMAAVAVGPWALGTLAATALGFSGDDEEDLRQFLPDWQKNSQIILLGRNGSEINYVDVSYLDPFEIWKKPMTAFFRGLGNANNAEEFFTEAVVGAALEAGRPFTSEQILSGAIMDVMRNRDANGRQVYNPQDSGAAIAYAVGKQLATAFAPGSLDTAQRIYKAAGNQVSETGRDYNVLNETLGVPSGSRVSAVDAEQALGFKASQFLRARRDARSIFNRDYLSRGSRSESDVISAYQRSNAGLRDVTEQLRREYIAALNLGVSPTKARSIIRAAGLDRDTARMISTGIYRRLTPSEEQDRMAAPERRRAVRQAISETPQREVLFP